MMKIDFRKCAVVCIIALMGVVYGNFVYITAALGFGLNQTWVAGVAGYVAGAWITAGVLWVKK